MSEVGWVLYFWQIGNGFHLSSSRREPINRRSLSNTQWKKWKKNATAASCRVLGLVGSTGPKEKEAALASGPYTYHKNVSALERPSEKGRKGKGCVLCAWVCDFNTIARTNILAVRQLKAIEMRSFPFREGMENSGCERERQRESRTDY